MSAQTRRTLILWATTLLTITAFLGSYRHGVQWATDWTKPDQGHPHAFWPAFWIRVTAGLPEVMVALSVLKAQDNPRDIRAWVVGGSAVGWQLWANGSQAGPGVSGLVIALWPAWAALGALWLAGHGPGDMAEPSVPVAEPRKRATRPPVARTNVPVYTEPRVPLAARTEPSGHDPDPGSDGPADTAMSRGVAWAMSQPTLPTRAMIVDEVKCSTKTASRIRTATQAARAANQTEGVSRETTA